MKVVLTHGYFLNSDAKEQQIMKPYPPLGILYISAYLNQYKISNQLFDATFSSAQEQLQYIEEQQPAFVAFYCNLMTKVSVLSQIAKMKANPKLSGIKIILGGPDVTYNTSNYLKYGAGVLVIGEGEETMKELLLAPNLEDKTLAQINGLVYLNANGVEIKTPVRTKIKDIDELPFPNREDIDFQKYFDVWKKHHGESALNVSTQRGCPYTCKWCSTAVYGQSYRRRSPALVVQELAHIKKQYKPDTIWFVDDVFTVSHKWIDGFAAELKAQNVQIKFECITRAERLTTKVIQQLKEAGCFRIWIGAESGSQRIIDKMDRRVSVTKVRDIMIEVKEAGIEAGTFIMLGYPEETSADIKETIKYLKLANPNQFTITLAYPIKGTELYKEIEPVITNQPKWNLSSDREIEFKRTYSTSYYKHAVRYVTSTVEFNKLTVFDKIATKNGIKLLAKSIYSSFGMQFYK